MLSGVFLSATHGAVSTSWSVGRDSGSMVIMDHAGPLPSGQSVVLIGCACITRYSPGQVWAWGLT